MPHIKLNAIQTALGNAHGKLRAKIQAEAERFERHVARKRGRFQREMKNGDDAFFDTLAESVGQMIPKHATVIPMPDGSMILSWPDPPKAATPPPADKQASEATGENIPDHDLATVTKIPTNGAEPAGAT